MKNNNNNKMATPYNEDGFIFSVDLLQRSKEHVFFLKCLHPVLIIQKPSSHNIKSLQRYRDLWLPLVYQYQHNNNKKKDDLHQRSLLPPPDCAWLWHCHRLAPFRYTSYLKSTFGQECKLVEANPPFSFQHPDGKVCKAGEEKEDDEATKSMSEETRKLWNQMYPNEPFFLLEENNNNVLLPEEEKKMDLLLDGFDLHGSTDRQASFLWQVSGPRFMDDEFLQDGVSQYYKFLKLRNINNKTQEGTRRIVLVPTYQIDLMWHTHILANLAGYYMDCKTIMGSTLNHDDSLNDRTEDGPLDRAFKETKALWKQTYGEEYFIEGGMYRGEPPKDYYSPSWKPSPILLDDDLEVSPTGLFLHLIGLQGASSTNPTGGCAYDMQVIWTWKETSSQMSKHDSSKIVGDPADCWIKYDDSTNLALETAFKGQGGKGGYDLGNGYSVDFTSMKQTKSATGHQRDIQRHVDVVVPAIEKPKIWCWKETPSQMSNHPASSVFGNPANCWIKYDDTANAMLESAFQAQGQFGENSPMPGYKVDFTTMKQTKISTGYQRDVQRVDADTTFGTTTSNAAWTPVNGTAPDGLPAFVTANTKSTTRGVNANPYKKSYIFGKKSTYTGYYHITTNEAYQIMAARVGVRAREKEGTIDCCTCCTLGLCGSSGWMKAMKADLRELQDIQAIATARANAPAPRGIVGLRQEVQNDQQKRNQHYSDSGEWFFPAVYYSAAGGCGAGTVRGGSSGGGGGACGAAACGAAGCGGGGCGGGGCGGGGCGG